MDKDLNIDHYDFIDLLGVFKIETVTQIEKRKKMVEKIKSPDIKLFYQKGFMILSCIHELILQSFLLGTDEEENIAQYIEKIKLVPRYHEKDVEEIIHIFSNKSYIFEKKDSSLLLQKKYNPNNVFYNSNPNTTHTYPIQSYVNPVTDGNVNYLKRMVHRKNIHLNSCFRDNYYQSNPCDFYYTIPASIQSTISIQLTSIELPNSWYLFSTLKKNNVMKIQLNDTQQASVYEIVIPDGNYDIKTLPHLLNSQYFCESENENDLRFLKCSIHPTTGRTEIKLVDEHPNITFSVYFNESPNANIMNQLGWILGFRLSNYLNVTQICSEGLYDGGGDRYIYVSVNDFQNNVNENSVVCFDKSILDENVLAKIPLVNGKFSITSNDYNGLSLSKSRIYNGPVNLRRLHIKLLDKFGDVIDLNNMDYSLTFEVEILYENLGSV